jgi:hypothetical protein
VLEESLLTKRTQLKTAVTPETGSEGPETSEDGKESRVPITEIPDIRPYEHIEGPARERHERLVEQWKEIRRLHLAGAKVKDIAEWADMNGWERAEAVSDPALPGRWHGGPFLQGVPQPATDVLYGEVSGHRMISFTHTWRTGTPESRFSRKRYAHVLALDATSANEVTTA